MHAQGGDADPRTHRAMKSVRPVFLLDGCEIHYLWRSTAEGTAQLAGLQSCAQGLTHLGWGTDLAVATIQVRADEDVRRLEGERWAPHPVGSASLQGLRLPVQGTLDELQRRHEEFLRRVQPEGIAPPPPLVRFAKASYRRAWEPPPSSFIAFGILSSDGERFRAFSATRRALSLAGMLRHAARRAAENAGWDEATVQGLILGHGEIGGPRIRFLPVPTVEMRKDVRRLGDVRRCLLAIEGPLGAATLDELRDRLAGVDLLDVSSGATQGYLSPTPATDPVLKRYLSPGTLWTTATPMVLPGMDDPDRLRKKANDERADPERRSRLLARLAGRTEKLIRKAMLQSGFGDELAACSEIEWQSVGYIFGADHVRKYGVPDHLRQFPRYHVRIHLKNRSGISVSLPGPLCLGAGRFYGLGLLVSS